MRSVIWKFPVPAQGDFTLDLPEGPCAPLDVQMQLDHRDGTRKPHLWVRVSADQKARKTKRQFFVVGTGIEFDAEGLTYVGTFQPTSSLVFHLFAH